MINTLKNVSAEVRSKMTLIGNYKHLLVKNLKE